MSLFANLLGNVAEVSAEDAQAEFAPILVDQEQVVKAFRLFRDMVVMTNLRLIIVNKQGLTGSKQFVKSIPYKSIKSFAKESAGFLDADAELSIWLTGEAQPLQWEFSSGVDINEVYRHLSYYVLRG